MGIARCWALAVAAICLASCDPMSSGLVRDLDVRDWVGHSEAHLTKAWGVPHHDYPTADGGRAIGYMFASQWVTGPESLIRYQATNCMINFTVDRNGIIDDASMLRAKCRIGPHGDMHPPTNPT